MIEISKSSLSTFKELSTSFSLIRLKGKKPIEPGWERYCEEKRDFDAIEFREGDNAGIATGPASDVLGLDIDDMKLFKRVCKEMGWIIPSSRLHVTGAKKPHMLFQYPNDGKRYGNRTFKQWGFDLRGIGGQLVAPGSIHPETGEPYIKGNDLPLAPVPQWLLDLYEEKNRPQPPVPKAGTWTGNLEDLSISSKVKIYIRDGVPKGSRSEAIMTVANSLVLAGLTDEEIIHIFMSSPIGEKALEKGRSAEKWIQQQVARAREWVPEKAVESSRRPNEGHGSAPAHKGVTAAELLNMEFKPTVWVIQEILPEGFCILGGRPKIGKSWLTLNYGIAVATGGTSLGMSAIAQGEVLYLALEDNERRLQSRLRLCGGDLRPESLHFFTEWPRMDEVGLEFLEKWLDDHPDVRLVIIDTIAKLWPTVKKESGKTLYHLDYEAMSGLKKLADARSLSILGVHHLSKRASDDPIEQLSGSTGISGAADTIQILSRSRGKADAKLLITGRDVEEQELLLRFDTSCGIWVPQEGGFEQTVSPERQAVLDFLIGSSNPMGPADIAKSLDKSEGSVRRLLGKLLQEGLIHKVGYGEYVCNDGNTGNSSNTSTNGNSGNTLPLVNQHVGDEGTQSEKIVTEPRVRSFQTSDLSLN